MIPRTIFNADHEEFRASFRRFLEDEVMPHHDQWEDDQQIDRKLWSRAGELGFCLKSMAVWVLIDCLVW
jgi:alkylation response protein AidB-like acyl-CoA dehydrogenase